MIAAAQARQQLERLGLTEAAAVLDSRLEVAAQKQLPYADFLAVSLSRLAKRRLGVSATCGRARDWLISPAIQRGADGQRVHRLVSAIGVEHAGQAVRHEHGAQRRHHGLDALARGRSSLFKIGHLHVSRFRLAGSPRSPPGLPAARRGTITSGR